MNKHDVYKRPISLIQKNYHKSVGTINPRPDAGVNKTLTAKWMEEYGCSEEKPMIASALTSGLGNPGDLLELLRLPPQS